jgi:hypothetical protein
VADAPKTNVRKTCPLCGKESQVTVDTDRYNQWVEGRVRGYPAKTHSVQALFPDLSPGQREVLISGSHEDCFDRAFPDEGD